MLNPEYATICFITTNAYIYDADDGTESIRIDFTQPDENCFRGTGMESGEEYTIEFSEVDLKTCSFYELTPMNLSEYGFISE